MRHQLTFEAPATVVWLFAILIALHPFNNSAYVQDVSNIIRFRTCYVWMDLSNSRSRHDVEHKI